MTGDPFFYVIAGLAVALLGLSKGGLVGAGALSLPMMALVISPVAAAAILLPILIVQDVVGVWAFRRDWDGHVLAVMLPGSLIGIVLGYLLAAMVSPDMVLGAVGLLSILFGIHRLWTERRGNIAASPNSPDWVGTLFGVAAGFTSQIAHAGGPPYQMWVLPRRLSRDVFVGTTAIFFAATNWLKVPAYLALNQFTAENLKITAVLLPVAIISTFAGVALVKRVSVERFYTIIYVLMIAVGVKLVIDAV
jgi:uncharacterized protein